MKTPQMQTWSGEFGKTYTERNRFASYEEYDRLYVERFGMHRSELSAIHLDQVPRDSRILEVGCNIGNQLISLGHDGFASLYGVELQHDAVVAVHQERPELNVVQGSAFDIPFKDGFFDLVFTNNVLIHIAPEDLPKVMDEMVRVSRDYLWGSEYFAPEITEVPYRGHSSLLWKADYGQLFLDRFPELELVNWCELEYQDGSELVDKMYLLRMRKS